MARLLLFDFVRNPALPARAAAVIRAAGHEIVGWAARPKWKGHLSEATSAMTYPIQLGTPRLSANPTIVDAYLAADDEESLSLLIDREANITSMLQAGQLRLEILAWAMAVLDGSRPDIVIFSDAPHNAFSFATYCLAHARSIPTYYQASGPLPHLYTWATDVREGIYPTWADGRAPGDPPPLSPLADRSLRALRGTYETAMPAWTRAQNRRDTWSGRLRHVATDPRRLLRGAPTLKARTYLRKEALRRHYESRANQRPDLTQPYVVVFLHLQPERSSVPQGGRFGQQHRIIHALISTLPREWRVLVREHPSTFLAVGPKLLRGPWFYDAIEKYEGVELVSTSTPPFRLIDRAEAVVTITGTVGMEALARGKPVLTFGSAAFVGCEGAHRVRDLSSLDLALSNLASVQQEDVEHFVAAIESSAEVHNAGLVAASDPLTYQASGLSELAVLELILANIAGDC